MTKKHTLLLLAILCLGVLIGVTFRYPEGLWPLSQPESVHEEPRFSDNKVTDPQPAPNLESIETERIVAAGATTRYAEEERRYRNIEKQLAELQVRIENLEGEMSKNQVARRNDGDSSQGSAPTSRVSALSGEAKLVAAGIDESTAAWIQQQLDKNQMDELYLQNQASREGWLNKPRYHKARREIQQRFNGFREQLSEDIFDRLLYALDRPNRVVIMDVMQDSPAQQNGLNASDVIVSYDGTRVFSTSELQELTSGGDSSSWVLVEIRRNGEPLSAYVPGGPLGIRLTTGRVLP